MSVVKGVLVSILFITLSPFTMASDGEDLYTIKCACCHNDPNTLRIGESKIKKALTDDSIRAHYFKVSAPDTKLIIDYLNKD